MTAEFSILLDVGGVAFAMETIISSVVLCAYTYSSCIYMQYTYIHLFYILIQHTYTYLFYIHTIRSFLLFTYTVYIHISLLYIHYMHIFFFFYIYTIHRAVFHELIQNLSYIYTTCSHLFTNFSSKYTPRTYPLCKYNASNRLLYTHTEHIHISLLYVLTAQFFDTCTIFCTDIYLHTHTTYNIFYILISSIYPSNLHTQCTDIHRQSSAIFYIHIQFTIFFI